MATELVKCRVCMQMNYSKHILCYSLALITMAYLQPEFMWKILHIVQTLCSLTLPIFLLCRNRKWSSIETKAGNQQTVKGILLRSHQVWTTSPRNHPYVWDAIQVQQSSKIKAPSLHCESHQHFSITRFPVFCMKHYRVRMLRWMQCMQKLQRLFQRSKHPKSQIK